MQPGLPRRIPRAPLDGQDRRAAREQAELTLANYRAAAAATGCDLDSRLEEVVAKALAGIEREDTFSLIELLPNRRRFPHPRDAHGGVAEQDKVAGVIAGLPEMGQQLGVDRLFPGRRLP